MTRIENITTDAAGYTHTTYSDGESYYLGQPWATVNESAAGYTTMVGHYESNSYNGAREAVVAHFTNHRPVKTAAAAIRRAERWIAENSRKVA